MKSILILLFALSLYGGVKQKMFQLYQNKQYQDVCKIGFKNFSHHSKDETYISLYAFACLNSDHLDKLAVAIALLKHSKEARANSAYFSVILMQKKLLYHALLDNYDISALELPTTNYILSRVFHLYSQLPKHQARTFYLFEDPNDAKITYKLYLIQEQNITKMVIEEYYDTITLKRHIYW